MSKCLHCEEKLVIPVFDENDFEHKLAFCCHGCLTVYQVLKSKGLAEYYDIKERMGTLRKRAPVELRPERFDYLDDPEFTAKYTRGDLLGGRRLEFYIEGIHCLACLWLIEKLPDLCAGVVAAKLDLERSVVTVTLGPNGKFASCARQLVSLGYIPHPLKQEEDVYRLQNAQERSSLMRIGVAGAAAGNTMLYAVSLYGGAEGEYARLFNLLTVIFCLPVLTYCAWPFYQTAWNSLKNRVLSIDVPISLALLVGLGMGLFNLVTGVDENYFDSLSALVFLLLLSRYFLRKIQQRALAPSDLYYFHQQESVLRQGLDDQFEEIHIGQLRVGDVIQVAPSTMLPCDGIVLSGRSHLNLSLLTGESMPQSIQPGERIFSGTMNVDSGLLVRVENLAGETRLGHILKSVETGWVMKSQIVGITARVSQYFTLVVFILAAFLAILNWRSLGPGAALEAAITLLVVTCPCALALATPLTFIKTLSLAARHGIIIKSDEVVEKLAQSQAIFLDKTGTVTYGKLSVREFHQITATPHAIADIIWTLEQGSSHPIARALKDYVQPSLPKLLPVQERTEQPGKGVSGIIDGVSYHIDRQGVWSHQTLVARFNCEDLPREDSKQAVADLRGLRLKPTLLSGDNSATVEKIAQLIGLRDGEWQAEVGPEKKGNLLQSLSGGIMVGDGANDAVALSRAYVGVAVAGAMDISLRAADVYLTTPGLAPVVKLVTLSRETMRVVKRNLLFSLGYNAISVLAAFTGHITPLVAAIIMPLSSLTVLLSTIWGTKKMRRIWKS